VYTGHDRWGSVTQCNARVVLQWLLRLNGVGWLGLVARAGVHS
jgi:hypothetical protein